METPRAPRMTAEAFAYWLQGYMEVQNPKEIDKTQTQIIKDHLALVFNKVTPDRSDEEQKLKEYLEKEAQTEAGWFEDEFPEHSIDEPLPILDCNLDIS